jgi:hypothetical protein
MALPSESRSPISSDCVRFKGGHMGKPQAYDQHVRTDTPLDQGVHCLARGRDAPSIRDDERKRMIGRGLSFPVRSETLDDGFRAGLVAMLLFWTESLGHSLSKAGANLFDAAPRICECCGVETQQSERSLDRFYHRSLAAWLPEPRTIGYSWLHGPHQRGHQCSQSRGGACSGTHPQLTCLAPPNSERKSDFLSGAKNAP